MVEVWLVEDDLRLRASIASSLERTNSGVSLTNLFGSVRETSEALRSEPAPHAALVDLGLPDGCGIQLIAEMARARPELVLLAFTVRFDDAAIFGALRAGAVGYLLKDAPIEVITKALVDAVAGGSPMSPSVARRVVRQLQPEVGREPALRLTQRELDVLDLLCSGASYREVARALRVAEGTVQTHVKHIYDKLGAANKAEAVRIALDARLVPLRNVG
ncbi:MAG TPA: response regulator transcription factor [Polyangiaceae bacterium]